MPAGRPLVMYELEYLPLAPPQEPEPAPEVAEAQQQVPPPAGRARQRKQKVVFDRGGQVPRPEEAEEAEEGPGGRGAGVPGGAAGALQPQGCHFRPPSAGAPSRGVAGRVRSPGAGPHRRAEASGREGLAPTGEERHGAL